MRGRRNPQITMLAFIDLEERVPTNHPLRTIKRLVDAATGQGHRVGTVLSAGRRSQERLQG